MLLYFSPLSPSKNNWTFVFLQNEITSSPSEAETVFLTPEPNETKELKINEALIQYISIHLYVIYLWHPLPRHPPRREYVISAYSISRQKLEWGRGLLLEDGVSNNNIFCVFSFIVINVLWWPIDFIAI